jgi:dihydrofolate reductase
VPSTGVAGFLDIHYRARVSFDVVVAADLEWGIGKANALPWPKLKGDMAHFRRVTSTAPEGARNAIIMGRKTWQSTEMGGKPLPKRLNVVITRTPTLSVPDGVLVAGSLDAALAAAKTPPLDAAHAATNVPGLPQAAGESSVPSPVHSLFVVGGAEIFREAFEHAALRWIYLTRVQGRFGCEVVIPDLDALGFVRSPWDGELEAEDSGVRYTIERLARPA